MTTDATEHLDRSLLDLDRLFNPAERAWAERARGFVHEHLAPYVDGWYEDEVWPKGLARAFGELGVLGMHLGAGGAPGASAVEYGIVCREIEACDSGLRSFVSVQGSLAMYAIHAFGSEEQKQRWLPGMGRGEIVGCFGLTEPHAGSDPSSMTTNARRDGSDWVLNGAKRWSTNASIAQIAIVWAKTDDGVRGFIVPTDTPGFDVRRIPGRLSLRASVSSEYDLRDVRLPADALLPGVKGLRGPLSCLNEARFGIVWGAVGAARTCLHAALDYARERTQFGRPLAGFQLTQEKLANMAVAYEKSALVALHLGRMKDAGGVRPEQISFGKLDNVRNAQEIARTARSILAANGVTDMFPVMRHIANLESVATYEGTAEIHTLVLGQALTGVSAFS